MKKSDLTAFMDELSQYIAALDHSATITTDGLNDLFALQGRIHRAWVDNLLSDFASDCLYAIAENLQAKYEEALGLGR